MGVMQEDINLKVILYKRMIIIAWFIAIDYKALDTYTYNIASKYIYMLMRDKEGRKKQARSYKQLSKVTHTQGSHLHVYTCNLGPAS